MTEPLYEPLYRQWREIVSDNRSTTVNILIKNCLDFLAVLENPMTAPRDGQDLPITHPCIRYLKHKKEARIYYLCTLIFAFGRLADFTERQNNFSLTLSLRQHRLRAEEIIGEILQTSFACTIDDVKEMHALVQTNEAPFWRSEETRGGKSLLWEKAEEIHNMDDLMVFLNYLSKEDSWASEHLTHLPADAQLVIQLTEGNWIRTFRVHARKLHVQLRQIDGQRLARTIYRLRREMERGTSTTALRDSTAWLRQEIFGAVSHTQTLYYIGIGSCTQLPISLLTDTPTVWLSTRPQFSLKSPLSVATQGTALWSDRALLPLEWAQEECRRLPRFRVLPATRWNVASALIRPEPVHLAAHAQASDFLSLQTQIFLLDSTLSIGELYDNRWEFECPLLFLCACETSARTPLTFRSASLAGALLDRGVGAVVAAKWRIPDDQAMVIAEAFWGWIRAGLDPIQALHEARRELKTPHAHAFELHF